MLQALVANVRWIAPPEIGRRRTVPLWGCLLSFAIAGTAAAQMPPPPNVEPELQERLVAIDHTVADGRFEEALARLLEIEREHPREAEVLWRLSRVKVDVGLDLSEKSDEQRRLFLAALEAAYESEKLDPSNPETHLAIAMAAGQLGLASGVRERVEYSREVRRHVDHTVDLNREHDVAYHVRGRWHHEVATLGFVGRTALRLVYGGLPDASLDQAVQDFQRAIEHEDRIVHRLELARTLIENNQGAEAPAHLEQALRMPHHAPRDHLYQQQARELLEEIQGR